VDKYNLDLIHELFIKLNILFPTEKSYQDAWAYRKEKIRGAETNLPDFFGFCPTSAKKFFPENINFDHLCTILGVQKFFRTYQNFSKHTNFPDITKFPTKLTQFPKK
jgi:hypothetical protein